MDGPAASGRRGSLAHAAKIVGAYLGHNSVSAVEIPQLLASVYQALERLRIPSIPEVAPLDPAIAVKKSVTPDFIICLEDGKKFKSMRRHLMLLGMTPEEYRLKWGLPQTYPMVAPNYAATRSRLARAIGLGKGSPRRQGKRKSNRPHESGNP